MPKKQRMKKFKMTEISAVDRPAQAGAKAVIMKRADGTEEEFTKGGKMLSVTNGHQHILVTDHGDGEMQSGTTRWAKAQGEDHEHSHPWVRNADGSVTIGMADGHTHDIEYGVFKSETGAETMKTKQELVAAITKYIGGDTSQGEEITKAAKELGHEDILPAALAKMSGKEKMEMDEKMKMKQKKAEKLALMNDAQKSYYKSLDDAGKEEFLKMSDEVMDAEIAKANATPDADTVIYKSDTGDTFTKGDDPRIVAMAKRNDEQARELKKANATIADADILKRANDIIPNLGKSDADRVAMLKSIDAIEDEDVRKSSLESLKGANAAMGKNFSGIGTSDIGKSSETATAEATLDDLAKAKASSEGISFEKAYDAVLSTPDGQRLYTESVSH